MSNDDQAKINADAEQDGVTPCNPIEGDALCQAHPIEDEEVRETHPPEGEEEGRTPSTPLEDDEAPEPETFPREYVEKLRKEAADARVKAKRADDLAQRLHVALVAADGRLVAPEELPFDEAHLEDAAALTAAVDHLLGRKPYLGARRVRGDVGQGPAQVSEAVDLAGILRARA